MTALDRVHFAASIAAVGAALVALLAVAIHQPHVWPGVAFAFAVNLPAPYVLAGRWRKP